MRDASLQRKHDQSLQVLNLPSKSRFYPISKNFRPGLTLSNRSRASRDARMAATYSTLPRLLGLVVSKHYQAVSCPGNRRIRARLLGLGHLFPRPLMTHFSCFPSDVQVAFADVLLIFLWYPCVNSLIQLTLSFSASAVSILKSPLIALVAAACSLVVSPLWVLGRGLLGSDTEPIRERSSCSFTTH